MIEALNSISLSAFSFEVQSFYTEELLELNFSGSQRIRLQ